MEILEIVCKTSLSPSKPIILVTKSKDEKGNLQLKKISSPQLQTLFCMLQSFEQKMTIFDARRMFSDNPCILFYSRKYIFVMLQSTHLQFNKPFQLISQTLAKLCKDWDKQTREKPMELALTNDIRQDNCLTLKQLYTHTPPHPKLFRRFQAQQGVKILCRLLHG